MKFPSLATVFLGFFSQSQYLSVNACDGHNHEEDHGADHRLLAVEDFVDCATIVPTEQERLVAGLAVENGCFVRGNSPR